MSVINYFFVCQELLIVIGFLFKVSLMKDHLVVKVFKIGLHFTGFKLWKHFIDEFLYLCLFFLLPLLFLRFYLGLCLALVGIIL